MADVNAVCDCGKDMTVEPQGSFVRLYCSCGRQRLINVEKMKGSKDTQRLAVITKEMSEDDIQRAQDRLLEEDRKGEFSSRESSLSNMMVDAVKYSSKK